MFAISIFFGRNFRYIIKKKKRTDLSKHDSKGRQRLSPITSHISKGIGKPIKFAIGVTNFDLPI